MTECLEGPGLLGSGLFVGEQVSEGNQELGFGHIKFEMPVGYSR